MLMLLLKVVMTVISTMVDDPKTDAKGGSQTFARVQKIRLQPLRVWEVPEQGANLGLKLIRQKRVKDWD